MNKTAYLEGYMEKTSGVSKEVLEGYSYWLNKVPFDKLDHYANNVPIPKVQGDLFESLAKIKRPKKGGGYGGEFRDGFARKDRLG